MMAATDEESKGWLSLMAWFICYLVIVIAAIVMLVLHQKEQKKIDQELHCFEEVDSNEHSFLESSRYD